MSELSAYLDQIRRDTQGAPQDRGAAFEKLVRFYLSHDAVQKTLYSKVQTFSEWANERGEQGQDAGIDLVAELADGKGYVAIQCKFFSADTVIQRRDLDTFISASSRDDFQHRVFVDTTEKEWGANARNLIPNLSPQLTRLTTDQLEKSNIDWGRFIDKNEVAHKQLKKLRPHQEEALEKVFQGFEKSDRGKLIMACGTGKTLTSLRIAEEFALGGQGGGQSHLINNSRGNILYLVPSLALMGQTVREWNNDTRLNIRSFAVCSDSQIGTRRKNNNDIAEISVTDLEIPATTDPEKLAEGMANKKTRSAAELSVVFATYQSIQVIAEAQKNHAAPQFDLIVCDEAHRTTGATLAEKEESNFVKVHDNGVIDGKKRLYMTATPRIFSDAVVQKARDVEAVLASMGDEELFGPVFHYLSFGRAVEDRLLSDYKVVVLGIDEGAISAGVQSRLADDDNALMLDDATKIVGCYKALAKQGLKVPADPEPMRRALAFCKSIRASKLVESEFTRVVDEYVGREGQGGEKLTCDVKHIDGTFRARKRAERLDWLREDSGGDSCRILTNARVLSEGVDVPALDAILFLHPRKSQVDVVQAVGRVMRLAEGKKLGYVILPVGIPAGVPPAEALSDNKKFQVIWQILNALRAHDERLDAVINQGGLGQDISDRIEVVAVVDQLPGDGAGEGLGIGDGGDDEQPEERPADAPEQLQLPIDEEFSRAVMAKLVEKCGNRSYWEDWATDVAEIAQKHISRLKGLLKGKPNLREKFEGFLEELRAELNSSVGEEDAVEMLAQHIVTRPVFEALFQGQTSIEQNPVSRAIQKILDELEPERFEKEAFALREFYQSVSRRTEGLNDPLARQALAVELYDSFFRNAFKRTTDMLGVVYTPAEIVDFILRSVDDLLGQEFGASLASENINILDPFTGTGTFITRLIQSGLINPKDLRRKYEKEIFANEIMLLPYYIAMVNIESAYQAVSGEKTYRPFKGLNLTDTFEGKQQDLPRQYFKENSERKKKTRAQRIDVVLGNPPYSVGQRSQNDNAQNVSYPELRERINEKYVQGSSATNSNSLHDSYIRAIRWATDRIQDKGIVAFVTNASWLTNASADRMRACLREEFSSLYLFDLKGNARLTGEAWRKSGGKVFGASSRVPVVIALLVKNPEIKKRGGVGQIYYCDIGDYLSTKEKLEHVQIYGSVASMQRKGKWKQIQPDEHNDWINQRRSDFQKHIYIGNKKQEDEEKLFELYSVGLKTNRDAWCVNHSREGLAENIQRTLSFYNSEIDRYKQFGENKPAIDFVDRDPKKISWDVSDYRRIEQGKYQNFHEQSIIRMIYRPFDKQWCYYTREFNSRVYQLPKIFPECANKENHLIALTGPGAPEFSMLMVDCLPNLHTVNSSQCFPFKTYSKETTDSPDFLNTDSTQISLTDQGLKHFQQKYPNQKISKEDIFYYTYAVLHSEEYREVYKYNLTRELPRIPLAPDFKAFRSFVQAGRKLGHLHVNYETVEPYPKAQVIEDKQLLSIPPEQLYRVEQMKFAGNKRNPDKTQIVYNARITLADIPPEAYDYVVNSKSAIAWVMDRQCVRTDQASGIVNDANDYANETMNDPRYPLDLLRRVITVSLDTLKIVRSLPELGLD